MVKDNKASDDFLSLDDDVKQCHDEASDECNTRIYVETVIENCGCLPLSMKTSQHQEVIIDVSVSVHSSSLQVRLCQPSELGCVENIAVTSEHCLKSCSGLSVTSFLKTQLTDSSFEGFWSKVSDDYPMYKSAYQQGNVTSNIHGYEWRDSWKLVGVFFDTPGYDEIQRDTSAKLVDKFGVIGGTFGLFTGFSIISGVEIIYFLVRILISLWPRQKKQEVDPEDDPDESCIPNLREKINVLKNDVDQMKTKMNCCTAFDVIFNDLEAQHKDDKVKIVH